MEQTKRILISAALPYVNGTLHLGHVAGAYLPADMYARYNRLRGRQVLFVCGSDEHGVAITISAEKEGTTPAQLIDKYHFANSNAFKGFDMSFDIFSRTSTEVHRKTAQEFFLSWRDSGLIHEKEEDQFFDEDKNMFLPDRYVEGTCPNCGYDKARGDQCDNCGAYYNQLELKNPLSTLSGKTPVIRKTKHWYFDMARFQGPLEEYIESHAKDWKDNVLQQSRSWLKQGLSDRAVTRDLAWGVPVPSPGYDGKVIYVWFEAVLGYISATKEWCDQTGSGSFEDWWKNPSTQYVAFLGKDNIVFHALIFPMILMSAQGYILPSNVPANEFLNLEGQKFSKSRNWGVWLEEFIREAPDPVLIDTMRYTLAMILPENRDSDFTWKDFQSRNNNELAAILGNYAKRVLDFTHRSFGGVVPTLPDTHQKLPEAWALLVSDLDNTGGSEPKVKELFELKYMKYFDAHDFAMIVALHRGVHATAGAYQEFRLRDAVIEAMNVCRAANKFFNDTEPWKSVKADPDRCARSLFLCLQVLRSISILVSPFLPRTASTIQSWLGMSTSTGLVIELQDTWHSARLPLVPQGQPLARALVLFPKIEDTYVEAQIAKLGPKNQEPKEVGGSGDLITIDDFKKIQLRTAKILEASRVPKSDKLIKLLVDTGSDQRQVLAGIGKSYSPEELIGKTVVVVFNLKPAKLMGLESNGMLLAANTSDGRIVLVEPSAESPVGAEVR